MNANSYAVFSNGMPSPPAAAAAHAAARMLARQGWQLRICGNQGIESIFLEHAPSRIMFRSARDRGTPRPADRRITRSENTRLLARIRDLRLHRQPFASPRHAAHYAKLLATLAGPRFDSPVALALLYDSRSTAIGTLPFVRAALDILFIPAISILTDSNDEHFLATLSALCSLHNPATHATPPHAPPPAL